MSGAPTQTLIVRKADGSEYRRNVPLYLSGIAESQLSILSLVAQQRLLDRSELALLRGMTEIFKALASVDLENEKPQAIHVGSLDVTALLAAVSQPKK